MIVRSRHELAGTDRDVQWGNGSSIRLLLREDEVGLTVTHTRVNARTESHIRYERHCEACYCIAGEGEVSTPSGVTHVLEPGVLYSPMQGEAHTLRALTDLHLLCAFLPALEGFERHELCDDRYSSY